jgi:membrane protein DedA with SNARE-associated domain
MESFLIHAGYGALILFGFLEACCIPMSSEVTFGFAGVLAGQGHLSLLLVIILGTLAELAGSYVSYAVGRVAERPVVERLGRYVLITKSDLDRAERFLTGRGAWAIPVGRALPVVRAFTSIVAGFAGVPAIRFGILSLIGTVVYATVVASIGYAVGSAWHSVSHDISVAGYIIVVLVVLAIAAFVVIRLRELRREARAEAAAPGAPASQAGDRQVSSRTPEN